MFLLLLGYLNLLESAAGENYRSLFWDLLGLVLLFLVFWLVDRRMTRYRFLAGYAFLVGLPILLLIWQAVQGVEAPVVAGQGERSWWGGLWPFFFWALIFWVLEGVLLIATREREGQLLGAVKDAVFFGVYGILLIVAIP